MAVSFMLIWKIVTALSNPQLLYRRNDQTTILNVEAEFIKNIQYDELIATKKQLQ